MKILKWMMIIILIPIVAFALFLLYASLSNYTPGDETVQSVAENPVPISDTLSLSIVSWNIGYAGLDKDMDFFYDGGKMVRPTKEASIRNFEGILKTLKKYHDYDFVLLQEVDVKSKRSYGINQYETIAHHFKDHSANMGTNYKVKFVPLPPTNPMGKVNSGIATFSKKEPAKSVRHSFKGNYSWPMSLFMLDRCFLVNEYPLESGKKLFIINTHNSAYDDGSLRKQQMDYLRSILIDHYRNDDYVIVGGDWNQCPNGFTPNFDSDIFDREELAYIEADYPEKGWNWAFDSSIPTNRRVMIPYEKGKTPTTLIDFFLLSPNIQLEEVNGRILGFNYSDHQPVELKIKLIPSN